jgi:hypothetical protein
MGAGGPHRYTELIESASDTSSDKERAMSSATTFELEPRNLAEQPAPAPQPEPMPAPQPELEIANGARVALGTNPDDPEEKKIPTN